MVEAKARQVAAAELAFGASVEAREAADKLLAELGG